MKKLPFLIALALLTAASLAMPSRAAEQAAATPPQDAKAELRTIAAYAAVLAPPDAASLPPEEVAFWLDRRRRDAQEKLEAFFASHPQDPLRWEAVFIMELFAPPFFRSFPPHWDAEKNKLAGVVFDIDAKTAWLAKVAAHKKALMESSDAPEAFKAHAAASELSKSFDEAERMDPQYPVNFPELRAKLLAYFAQHPDLRFGAKLIERHLALAKRTGPDAVALELAELGRSETQTVAQFARERIQSGEQRKQTVDIRFTALDGTEVDLAKLRGKVVLVDFWATWCGPCVAELPNVKRVYEAYHARGFEVVGIALEQAYPGATPEEAAANLAKVRQRLIDFTTKEKMPWPQYFDGKHWKTEIAVRYGINSIPAMFLIDQNGKIVSTEARGPKLEQEVKRLLKL